MGKSAVITAGVASVLFACTLGVLVAVAAFGVVRIFEQMAEGLSFLPARWGENNLDTLLAISGVVAVPVALWFIVWFYRKAVASEVALANYQYVPPKPVPAGKS